MSANPIGVEVARNFGLNITFGSWLVAASVPALAAIVLLPLFLYKVIPPEVKSTPEAPTIARKALREMGPLSRDEKIVSAAFAAMVGAWATAGTFHLDSAAIAFAGLGVMLLSSVLTLDDIAKEGDTLNIFIWLAVLFALSSQLNEMGFMGFVGERLAGTLTGLAWPVVYVALLVLYVGIHYMFVSQTSQVLALFGVFLDVGVRQGVPAGLLAFALLFASSYFSVVTPQGSSANVIFVGSGYLTQGELYKIGGLTTAFNFMVFLVIGTPWLLWVAR
jgi:DASS family divalent anion:Na+ symporter